jgi:hypothetical protein
VNRLDQETVKRRGPTRAVEPLKRRRRRRRITIIIMDVCTKI